MLSMICQMGKRVIYCRHKGTLIYNLKELTLHLKSIYSSASAQPLLGLIELKTQGTLYIYNLILSHIFHPKISIVIRRNCINHWYKTRDCLYMLFLALWAVAHITQQRVQDTLLLLLIQITYVIYAVWSWPLSLPRLVRIPSKFILCDTKILIELSCSISNPNGRDRNHAGSWCASYP